MKRIALLLIFLFSLSFGDTLTYVVPNFLGGINVAMDSVDIAPNEAVDITNLTLDMPNCLSARHGYTVWNSTQINNADIKGIFIYEPYAGTYRVVVACSNYVYIYPGLSGEDSVTNWANNRLSFKDDSLIFVSGNKEVHRPINAWWYSRIGYRDRVKFSDNEYSIDSITTGNYAYLNTASSTSGTDTFRVYKWFQGIPRFTQYRDELYITDSLGFGVVYDDTNWQYIGVIDTGRNLQSPVAVGDSVNYQTINTHIDFNSRIASYQSTIQRPETTYVGYTFRYRYYKYITGWGYQAATWQSTIDSVSYDDTIPYNGKLYLNNSFPDRTTGVFPVRDYWNSSSIIGDRFACNAAAHWEYKDNYKNWMDDTYGEQWLFDYKVFSTRYKIRYIYCNSTTSFSVADSGIHNPYYIFSRIPSAKVVDTLQMPRFKQVIFYNDQMYGYGYDSLSGSRQHLNRVWYSEILLPSVIKWDYHFDLPDNAAITRLFLLNDRLYIATSTKIYSFSGSPLTYKSGGDASLIPILNSNGIPSYDLWVKATNEVGYFLNNNGLYEFNGVNAQKISAKVDPLLERYSRSRKVLGYFKDKLYVSYPDSNVTLVFYPEYDYACVKLGFGMTAFATIPKDTSLFLCGINSQKGYVCSYPNAGYTDILADGSASWYNFNYTTGWQSLNPEADFTVNKKLIRAYIPLSNASGTDLDVYASMVNPDTIAMNCDTTYAYPFVWVPYFNNRCYGEYFKLRFYGSSSAVTILRGYRIQWEPYQGLRK